MWKRFFDPPSPMRNRRPLNKPKRIDEDDLVVVAAYANQGPSFKRIRPAPMGRAFRIIHRTTHLTIRVAEKQDGTKDKAE